MSLRSLLSGLLSRWESAFDRAIRDGAGEVQRKDRANGEFISTLIIDHGAAPRELRRRLYD